MIGYDESEGEILGYIKELTHERSELMKLIRETAEETGILCSSDMVRVKRLQDEILKTTKLLKESYNE